MADNFNMAYGPQPDPYGNNILGQQFQAPGSQYGMSQFQIPGGAPGGGGGFGDMFSRESILGNSQTGTQGWGMPALQTFGGLASIYMGMKQYGLAKDSLKENKRQFNMNHKNQVSMVNNQLEDRQRARLNSNGGQGTYESVGTYMDKHGVS